MNKLIIIFILMCCTAFGGNKVCSDEDNTKCSQPISVGEVAPFGGQLLTPELAIDLGQKASSFDTRLNIEMERIKKLDVLDLELEKKLHDLDKASWKSERDLMLKNLEKLENLKSWYEHPVFVCMVSVIATGLLAYGMLSIRTK